MENTQQILTSRDRFCPGPEWSLKSWIDWWKSSIPVSDYQSSCRILVFIVLNHFLALWYSANSGGTCGTSWLRATAVLVGVISRHFLPWAQWKDFLRFCGDWTWLCCIHISSALRSPINSLSFLQSSSCSALLNNTEDSRAALEYIQCECRSYEMRQGCSNHTAKEAMLYCSFAPQWFSASFFFFLSNYFLPLLPLLHLDHSPLMVLTLNPACPGRAKLLLPFLLSLFLLLFSALSFSSGT